MEEINIDLLEESNVNEIELNKGMSIFEKFNKLQKLIKKESSLKEMCNKILVFIFI
jgi:hypothetical protein